MAGGKTTIISGGTVVTESETTRADVIIRGEEIVALMANASDWSGDDTEAIDATGLLVFPGVIDVHTHFWEPADELIEGFAAGGAGAIAGGVTTVVEMPQASPTTITAAQFREKRDVVGQQAITDMALWGGVIGEPTQPSSELAELAAEGAAAFKSFMASSSRSFPAVDDAQLHDAMRAIADLGLPYGIHAENDALVKAGEAATRAEGRRDPLAHAHARPPLVETVAVATVLQLAEATGCWVHICHCASPMALELIADARDRGVQVTVETCPQYLAADTTDLERLAGFARCAPAFRPPELVDLIWDFVLDETIDLICSDHCGYTAESKEKGADDIFTAPLGLPGVQTLFPVMYDAGVVQRGMSLEHLARLLAANPARIFGLHPRKGTIAVGVDADLVLFDPDGSWTVRDEDMRHRQRWTPFAGRTLQGRVQQTIRRGEVVFDGRRDGDDQILAPPGSGRFLARG